MGEKVLELVHLQKQFGDHTVLRDIHLSVEKGEVLSVIGASGSGKSTMLRCINLLETPTSGRVLYRGQDITAREMNLSQYRAKVGMVFQSFNLIPQLTVAENIALPLYYQGVSEEECFKRATEYADYVGLIERLKHRPNQLSGGQQQRVAIARALATNPVVILADEPTGNLDTAMSVEIMNLFTDLHRKGKTIIMVTHEEDIAAYAEHRLVMRDGLVKEVR